jgi:hypothetical protein
MSVTSIQCPQCGSPVQVEPAARYATCAYCASSLRITRGSSGHPLAVLEDIRADTGMLARQAAVRHLRQRLRDLTGQRNELQARQSALAGHVLQARQSALAAVQPPPRGRMGWGTLGTILTIIPGSLSLCILCSLFGSAGSPEGDSGQTAAVALFCLAPCVAVAVAGILLWRYARAQEKRQQQSVAEARRGVEEQYAAELRRLDEQYAAELRRLDEEIHSTTARIDRLKREMDQLAGEL